MRHAPTVLTRCILEFLTIRTYSVAVPVSCIILFFFFQAEDGIRDGHVTGVQTCALPISWSESLELTRAGWLDTVGELRAQLDAGEQLDDNATDAQLELRLDPVTDLTLSMVEDAVAEATSGIPGIENVSLDLETDLTTTVPTPIPPVNMLTAAQVVQAEELMTVWPAILALAAIVFVMALVVASRGSRWMVWLVTGLVAAISGAAVKLAYSWMQNFVLDRAADTTHATLLRPFLRAIQDWADPQILVLIAAAVGIALIGILGGFIASNRRGRR